MNFSSWKLISFIMILTIFLTACESAKKVEDKKVEMQTVIFDDEGVSWENVGRYKIFLGKDTNLETGDVKNASIYVQDKDDRKKLIEEVNESTNLSSNVITDGVHMYYSLSDYEIGYNSTGTIYKVALDSGEKQVIANIDSMTSLVGVYKDSLYYTAYNDTLMKKDLWSFSLKEKEAKLVKENFDVNDQFCNYLIGTKTRHNPNTLHYILNLETGEFTEIMSAWKMCLQENGLVYSKYTEDNSHIIIGECDYSGKVVKEKELVGNEKLWFMGRKSGFLIVIDGSLCKYNEDFEFLERVKFNIDERLLGNWENNMNTCVADTIELNFEEDGKVTCVMPRSIYYGTYEINSENVYMDFKEGDVFVQGSAEWVHEKNINFKIKGKVEYNQINLELGDNEGWNVSVTKSM